MDRKTNTNTVFSDFSLYADTDEQGNLRLLTGKEAVENALSLWLSSFPNEQIRRPSKGGFLIKKLMKPLSEETRADIKETILEGLYEDFVPALRVRKIEVIPDYENQSWEIYIEAYVPEMKLNVNVEEQMRAMR